MNSILRKLSSRKLWMAIGGFATGIAMVLGADSTDIQTVAGAITSLVSVITYIVTEGKIDAESVKNTIEITGDAIDILEEEE